MQFIKTIRELLNVAYLFETISSTHVRSLGLTPGQFDVIATLGNQLPMTCKELANKTLMVKGNLTVILESLLKKELITRSVNPDDRRSALIGLTEGGISLFSQVFPAHTEYLEPLCTQFDNKQIEHLRQELILVKNKLEKFVSVNQLK